MSEATRLIENLGRLREHAEAVRAGSPTARDGLDAVLHITVGGDRYGLVRHGWAKAASRPVVSQR
jgi:hypothetical protein